MATGNGDTPTATFDSDKDIPLAPGETAEVEERIRFTESAAEHLLRETRRMRRELKGLGDEISSIHGYVMRIESVVLSMAAWRENHMRESEPPSLERIQEIRAAHDRQAKRLDRLEVERRVRGAKVDARLSELDSDIKDLKGDVKETTKRASLTSEAAIETLARANERATDVHVAKAREEVAAAKSKAQEEVASAKSKRALWVDLAVKAAPLLLAALGGVAATKVQGCLGGHAPTPAPAIQPASK